MLTVCSLLFVYSMSYLIKIMPILVHTIWSIYVRIMTPQIIIVFCINCPSFTLLFVVFHPSRHFSISFEILNEAKMIHHYVNGYSCMINLALNVLPLESILVMNVYYFSISIDFSNVNLWNCRCWWLRNQLNAKSFQLFPIFKLLSTIHFMCHLFPSLGNSYGV
jgi:hypothetical protein